MNIITSLESISSSSKKNEEEEKKRRKKERIDFSLINPTDNFKKSQLDSFWKKKT
jgi:hypothetical protein